MNCLKRGNKLYVIAQFYPEWFTMMLKDGKTCSFGNRRIYIAFGNFDVNITSC
jgi:hypothetical protein